MAGRAPRALLRLAVLLLWCSAEADRQLESATVGNCMCDLTTNFCDANCCCDGDCSASEVTQFTTCLPEVWGQTNIPYCSATSTSATANDAAAQDPLRDAQQAVDAIFCIERASPNALQAQYYKAPEPLSGATLDTTVAADAKLAVWQRASAAAAATTTAAPLRVGDRLPAFVSTGASPTPTASGFLPVPVHGLSDRCSDFEYARFMVSRDAQPCARVGPLDSLCRGPLSVSRLQGRWVAAETVAAGQPTPSLLPLSLTFAPEASAPPATAWDPVGGCQNAVVAVVYTFSVEPSTGMLVNASAAVTLQALAATAPSAVTQTFAVRWRNAGNTSTPQPVSGRPGYQQGKPILAATSNLTGALTMLPEGYAVRAGSVCGPSAPLKPLRFLSDVYASGCAESLTAAEFRALCSAANTSSPALPAHLQRALFPSGVPAALGMFGDSDPAVASDWVNITYDPSPAAQLQDFPTGDVECQGLPTGLSVAVVVARFGAVPNPQDAIVGAAATYLSPPAVRWRADMADLTGRNRFWWQFRLAFVRPTTPQTTAQGGIKPPPLLPTLPVDIFYPFTLSGVSRPDNNG